MRVCNIPLISNYNCQNNVFETQIPRNSFADKHTYLSVPAVSPNYYTPNFTSLLIGPKGEKEKIVLSKEEFERVNKELKDLSQEETFDKLNIKYRKNDEGQYIISDFCSPFYIKETIQRGNTCRNLEIYQNIVRLNINPNKLLNNVVEVEGDVEFADLQLEPFKTLKRIGGSISGSCVKIKSLGSLEKVDGGMFIDGSIVEDLGNLKECGYITLAHTRSIRSLFPLKKANAVTVNDSNIFDVSSLEECEAFSGISCPIPDEQKERIREITKGEVLFTKEDAAELSRKFNKKNTNKN